jgi:uncharacterized membrane protein
MEDRCWRGGLFYFNPDDPALLVERRIGVGYGLNFGNLWARLLLGALLAIPLVVSLITKL